MTAHGKRTASSLNPGDRILLIRRTGTQDMLPTPALTGLLPSPRLTGPDVIVARVTSTPTPAGNRRVVFGTSAGEVTAVGHQTFTLAPETPAAVNRAHNEANAIAAGHLATRYATTEGPAPRPADPTPAPPPAPAPTSRIAVPSLVWRTLGAGQHITTDEQFMVVRDANANEANRWSLRRKGSDGPISAHRLLASAQRRAQRIVEDDAAAGNRVYLPFMDDLHGEALVDNRRFDRFAAMMRRGGEIPELFEVGTPVLISTSSRGGHPIGLLPGTVSAVVNGTMSVRYAPGARVRGATMVLRGTYIERNCEPCAAAAAGVYCSPACFRSRGADCETPLPPLNAQPEQQQAQADEPAPAALPAPAQRPTPADAIAVHFRETGGWPMASQIVRRGADLDELHAAEAAGDVERYEPYGAVSTVFRLPVPEAGRPLAVDDIVTVTPHRTGRQFDVIALDDIDNLLVRVMPRNPRDVEDLPRWVSAEYTNRVPAALVEPVEDDPAPQPFVDPWAGTATPEPALPSIEIVAAGKLDGAGLSVAVCSRGDYRSGPCTEPEARKRGDEHLLTKHGARTRPLVGRNCCASTEGCVHDRSCTSPEAREQWAPRGTMTITPSGARKIADAAARNRAVRGLRCVEAVAGTGATVHVVVNADGLVQDGHDVDQCPNPGIADMLRPAMPGQYRDTLTHLLTPHGFAAPTGIDTVAPDDANPEAFLIHDPTGIAVGTYERHVRLSYPAEHAGEGDGDLGAAYVDLVYGTSFETVADVAIGLVQRLMRQSHLDHMRSIAEDLRALAGDPLNRSTIMLAPGELRALADQLAPADTECKAAAYARRVTAVLHGVLGVLMDMTADEQPVEHVLLRALALNAAGAVTGPEPTADELVEHLAGRGVGAALVADDSAGPADGDELVDTLRGAGWRESAQTEYVAGRRVRYLTPPAGWQAGIHDGEPVERQTRNADGETQSDEPLSPEAAALLAAGGIVERPLTQAQVDAAECGEAFQTSARFGHTYYCARPPHGEDAFGHSVMRYPYGAPVPEATPAVPVDDELPAGTTLLSADELVDAGGFLMCGCHGSATEHSCGAAAPDTFDPAAEV